MTASGMVRDLATKLSNDFLGGPRRDAASGASPRKEKKPEIDTAPIPAYRLSEGLLLKEEDEEDRCEDCLRHLSFCGCGEYGEEEP